MPNTEKKLWFKARRFGWGWTPITWQGWLIVLGYVGIMWAALQNANKNSHSNSDFLIKFSISFIPVTIFLIYICYKKGENPWKK